MIFLGENNDLVKKQYLVAINQSVQINLNFLLVFFLKQEIQFSVNSNYFPNVSLIFSSTFSGFLYEYRETIFQNTYYWLFDKVWEKCILHIALCLKRFFNYQFQITCHLSFYTYLQWFHAIYKHAIYKKNLYGFHMTKDKSGEVGPRAEGRGPGMMATYTKVPKRSMFPEC